MVVGGGGDDDDDDDGSSSCDEWGCYLWCGDDGRGGRVCMIGEEEKRERREEGE